MALRKERLHLQSVTVIRYLRLVNKPFDSQSDCPRAAGVSRLIMPATSRRHPDPSRNTVGQFCSDHFRLRNSTWSMCSSAQARIWPSGTAALRPSSDRVYSTRGGTSA